MFFVFEGELFGIAFSILFFNYLHERWWLDVHLAIVDDGAQLEFAALIYEAILLFKRLLAPVCLPRVPRHVRHLYATRLLWLIFFSLLIVRALLKHIAAVRPRHFIHENLLIVCREGTLLVGGEDGHGAAGERVLGQPIVRVWFVTIAAVVVMVLQLVLLAAATGGLVALIIPRSVPFFILIQMLVEVSARMAVSDAANFEKLIIHLSIHYLWGYYIDLILHASR